MNSVKQNMGRWLFVFSSLLFLLTASACVCLSIGTAYGRYNTTVTENMSFDAQSKTSIYLTYEGDGVGGWVSEDGRQTLTFVLSNGDGERIYGKDMEVLVRLYLPGAEDPLLGADLVLETSIGESYTALHEKLNENSALYAEKGEGWIYTFYDTDNEITHPFYGGKLAELLVTMTVTVTDAESVNDIADYVLLVDRINPIKEANVEEFAEVTTDE